MAKKVHTAVSSSPCKAKTMTGFIHIFDRVIPGVRVAVEVLRKPGRLDCIYYPIRLAVDIIVLLQDFWVRIRHRTGE